MEVGGKFESLCLWIVFLLEYCHHGLGLSEIGHVEER